MGISPRFSVMFSAQREPCTSTVYFARFRLFELWMARFDGVVENVLREKKYFAHVPARPVAYVEWQSPSRHQGKLRLSLAASWLDVHDLRPHCRQCILSLMAYNEGSPVAGQRITTCLNANCIYTGHLGLFCMFTRNLPFYCDQFNLFLALHTMTGSQMAFRSRSNQSALMPSAYFYAQENCSE